MVTWIPERRSLGAKWNRWREGVFMGALYNVGRWWWAEEMVGRVAVVENQFFLFDVVKEREKSRSDVVWWGEMWQHALRFNSVTHGQQPTASDGTQCDGARSDGGGSGVGRRKTLPGWAELLGRKGMIGPAGMLGWKAFPGKNERKRKTGYRNKVFEFWFKDLDLEPRISNTFKLILN
jgi:hypothetical protein